MIHHLHCKISPCHPVVVLIIVVVVIYQPLLSLNMLFLGVGIYVSAHNQWHLNKCQQTSLLALEARASQAPVCVCMHCGQTLARQRQWFVCTSSPHKAHHQL